MQFPRYYLMADLLTSFWRVCIVQGKQKNIMNTKYIVDHTVILKKFWTFINLETFAIYLPFFEIFSINNSVLNNSMTFWKK